MTGSIFERFGWHVDADGIIRHDDRPCSWERGDELAGRHLDRRRSYAVIEGAICELASWSYACSGCYEGMYGHTERGCGCSECGFTGRRRNREFVPV